MLKKPAKNSKKLPAKLDKQNPIKKKKLEEYVQTHLANFTTLTKDPYSHTIELYDAIPKYVWGNQQRIEGIFLKPLKRKFRHRNKEYDATISPASVEMSNGEFKYFFPGLREELVEDALRKLASDGQGVFLDEYASVVFTLYELRQELKRKGHTYSISEIKESLLILANTGLTLTSADGKSVISSTLFETLGLESKNDVGNGKAAQCFVRFNFLVTQSIKTRNYRLLNYDDCMRYKKALARWFHKRMNHNYKQAHIFQPYTISLSTVVRDSGIEESSRVSTTLQRVTKALVELQEQATIASYDIEKIYDPNNPRKLIDAKFTLIPGDKFTRHIISANRIGKGQSVLGVQEPVGNEYTQDNSDSENL